MNRFIGLFFVLFSFVFLTIGAYQAYRQDWKIKNFKPVEAVIVSSDVASHTSRDSKGHSSTTYSPEITYNYIRNGKTFTAKGAYPISMSSSSSWAYKTVNMFPKGKNVTAYINPEDPHDGFVIKQYLFFPYFFLTFPLVFTAIGVFITVYSSSERRKLPRQVMGSQWYQLEPKISTFKKALAFLVSGGFTSAIGYFACIHYFISASRPYEIFSIITTAGIFGFESVFTGIGIYYLLLNKTVNEAQVFISGDKLKAGGSFKAAIRQRAKNPIFIEESLAGIKCVETNKRQSGGKTEIYTNTLYEDIKPLAQQRQVRAGENFECAVDINVPNNFPPSTPPGTKGYPIYDWYFSVKNKIAQSPDYKNDFYIFVENP